MTTHLAAATEAEAPLTPPSDGQPGANRPSRPRRGLLVAGVVAVVGIVAWVLFASPLLAVKEVEVTGLGSVPPEQVVSAAGIAPGTAMLTLNTSAAAERVTRLDAVAGAEVTRQWPSTVTISVVPDAPVGASQEGSQWLLWGAQGGQLSAVGEPPADLPQLSGIPAESRVEALGVLAALPADARGRVEQITWDERRGYVLTLREQTGTVRWGDASEPGLKATVLTALLGTVPDARWFDVSAPGAPRTAVAEPVRSARDAEQETQEGELEGSEEVAQQGEETPVDPAQADDQSGGQADEQTGGQTGGGEQSLGLQPR